MNASIKILSQKSLEPKKYLHNNLKFIFISENWKITLLIILQIILSPKHIKEKSNYCDRLTAGM